METEKKKKQKGKRKKQMALEAARKYLYYLQLIFFQNYKFYAKKT